MACKLTRHETYLFGLTGSAATTAPAQRAAIARAGLSGLTRADVERKRREHWREYRAKNPGVPSWVLALRVGKAWDRQLPKGVKPGTLRPCSALRNAAYHAIDWGRLRKHSFGKNCAWGAGVREEDNGKSGWDRVVHRYADYGCILSPDGRHVAYSIRAGKWRMASVWRERFMVDGQAVRLDAPERSRYSLRLRDCLRLLTNAGIPAYLTRQTREKISAGSGARGRSGELVLIADLGREGFYHCPLAREVVREVRMAKERRIETREAAELSAIIDRGEAAGVLVCAADSYRAGNCRQGTAAFAGRHNLDMRRHYTAAELSAQANGDGRFVRAAIVSALRRERREEAAGVCLLADHRS